MSEAMDCIRDLDHAREAAVESLRTEAATDYHRVAIKEAIRHIDEAVRIMGEARASMWSAYLDSVRMGAERWRPTGTASSWRH